MAASRSEAGSVGERAERIERAREMLAGTGYAPAPSFLAGGDAWRVQAELLAGRDVRTILDCGANLGHVTGEYLKAFPEATIHAFEPVPETFGLLRDRVGDEPRVHLVNAAVSDSVGEAEITLGDAHYADSMAREPVARAGEEDGRRGRKIRIRTTTIDAYCEQLGIDRVGVLKLDVEGVELEAIDGAERLLAEGRVDLVYSELNFAPRHPKQARGSAVIEALWAHGFRLFELYSFERPDPAQGLGWMDGLFLPATRHPGFIGR